MRRFLASAMCLLVLLGGCAGGNEVPDAAPEPAPDTGQRERAGIVYEADDLEALRKRAEQRGDVRVIVRLDVSVTPEGQLSEAEVQRQREAARSAQEALLSALEDTRFTLVRRYRGPFLALVLSPEAVDVLEDHPMVRSVTLDVTTKPARAASTSTGSGSES